MTESRALSGKFFYYLEGPTPVCCETVADIQVLETQLRNPRIRQVASTRSGNVYVSTVFLGVDHSFGNGPPLLFETMMFIDGKTAEQARYTTWDDAEKGHAAMCAKVLLNTTV